MPISECKVTIIFHLNCRLRQINSDLSDIYSSFQAHSEENSRQIDSFQAEESSIYETDVESYRRDQERLRKANKILIKEIKDLLTICFGQRRVGDSFCLKCSLLSIQMSSFLMK